MAVARPGGDAHPRHIQLLGARGDLPPALPVSPRSPIPAADRRTPFL